MGGDKAMNLGPLKTVDVIFPWEDNLRTISFFSSDKSAVDVLSSLIEDKGVEICSVKGFSADEICYLTSCKVKSHLFSCANKEAYM